VKAVKVQSVQLRAYPAHRICKHIIECTLIMCIIQSVFIAGLLDIEGRTWLTHSDRWHCRPFYSAKSCAIPRETKTA